MYSNPSVKFTLGQRQAQEKHPYPTSTLNKIVFPFNKLKNEYDIYFYQPHMTTNTLSKYDIDTFFMKMYSEVDYFCFATTRYIRKLIPCSIALPLSLLFISLFIHLCFVKDYVDSHAIHICLIILDIIAGIWALVGTVGAIRTYRRIECDTRMRISDFLEQQNMSYYSSKGMKWVLAPQNFNWVELHLHYKSKQETDAYFKALHEMVSSDQAVMNFFLNEETLNYEFEFYTTADTDNRLAKSDVEMFLNRIKRQIEDDLRKLALRKKGAIMLLVATLIGVILLLLKHSPNETANIMVVYFENIALVLYFITLCTFFIQGQRYFNKVKENIMNKIAFEAEKENATKVDHGVRWYLPGDDYRWLELWLDYRFIKEDIVIPNQQEKEDLTQYRFRDAESLPLFQWGKSFNFGFEPLKKSELPYISFSTNEDYEKYVKEMSGKL